MPGRYKNKLSLGKKRGSGNVTRHTHQRTNEHTHEHKREKYL